MPAGVSPPAPAPAAGGFCWWGEPALPSYGFQNFPPVTSSISTLYDWKRSSIVPIRGMVAGASARGSAAEGASGLPDCGNPWLPDPQDPDLARMRDCDALTFFAPIHSLGGAGVVVCWAVNQ